MVPGGRSPSLRPLQAAATSPGRAVPLRRGPTHQKAAMQAAESSASKLQRHMSGTYFALRLGLALIALGLPPLLALGGMVLENEPIRASMSAYYYSFTLRDVFVGALVAVGFLLMLYR